MFENKAEQIRNGNRVKIEGILSEIDLKEATYLKNGSNVDCVRGKINVRVNQTLPSGEEQELEIPVHFFANKITNAGKENPAYTSIMKVKNEFKSIAAVGIEDADRIRITGATIGMNDYPANGRIVSYPRINASFVNKIRKEDCTPQATFDVIFVVKNSGFETDNDGIENPDRYKISGIVPRYGGKVDVIDFLATNKNVIDSVSNYWEVGSTVHAIGRLNFTSRTEVVHKELDFGEPQDTVRTFSVSELIITGGAATPLEGEAAYDISDIQKALAERQADLEKKKESANTAKKVDKVNMFEKLGF